MGVEITVGMIINALITTLVALIGVLVWLGKGTLNEIKELRKDMRELAEKQFSIEKGFMVEAKEIREDLSDIKSRISRLEAKL